MLKENFQVLFLILYIYRSECFYPVYPEQIHLSLGNSPLEMVVTWVTFTETKNSFVWYGKVSEGLTQRANGYSRKFTVRKNSKRVRIVHRVVLQNLEPLNFYAYRCGSWYGASEPYVFKVSPAGTDWSPRLIIFGDMGWKGAEAFPYILNDASDYDVDAVVHVGDIAYDMATHDGFIGDQFMRMIQPLASCVPYMTCVGNHEQYQNFSHYKNIFSMPGNTEGLYYSFDLGPIHFVVISTEVYYFTQYGIEPIKRQYEWLENDLEMALMNRIDRPWIIVLGHRPMYCSSDDGEDCSLDQSLLRCCILGSCNYGLEDLFQKYRVDLIFSGHMHYYERSWPIYNKRVYNGSCAEPYRNAGAAVHIITGAGTPINRQLKILMQVQKAYLWFQGMKSGPESASYIRGDWFAFYSNEHSYSVLTGYNKSYIYLEQISATRGGRVIDSAWFIKDLQRS